jgi:hypothetical protein
MRSTASEPFVAAEPLRGSASTRHVLLVKTDPTTFARLGLRQLSPAQAAEQGMLTVSGDEAAAARCAAMFT